MIKLKFTGSFSEEKIKYEISDSNFNCDLNIHEYKEFCKKLAYVIGYHEKSINEAFGEYNE